jgi:hypothetical protein
MEAPQTCGSREFSGIQTCILACLFMILHFREEGVGFVLYVLGRASSQKDRGARVRAIF